VKERVYKEIVEEARESNVARIRIHDRVGNSEENSIY
jgi:hypothetical protein